MPPFSQEQLVLIIGSPRSGSTLLARMVGAHSAILGRPEPHLLTPLAHLGYYEKVDKAPYDAVLAAESVRDFVADLPAGEADYNDACRDYCNTLYGRMLSTQPDKRLFLDKTPAYALVLDFITHIYPRAKYIVLTRHPLAVFSSYAESFFNGDYQAANAYNPILERYVPAIAKFLRHRPVPYHHVVYEELVSDPAAELEKIFAHIGVANEPAAVDYGKSKPVAEGLGDPIGVKKHTRPSQESLHKWAAEVASNPARIELCRAIVARLDPDDLASWKHPLDDEFWAPLEKASSQHLSQPKKPLDRYRLQRAAIVRGRAAVAKSPTLRKLLNKARLASDVLLRE